MATYLVQIRLVLVSLFWLVSGERSSVQEYSCAMALPGVHIYISARRPRVRSPDAGRQHLVSEYLKPHVDAVVALVYATSEILTAV